MDIKKVIFAIYKLLCCVLTILFNVAAWVLEFAAWFIIGFISAFMLSGFLGLGGE